MQGDPTCGSYLISNGTIFLPHDVWTFDTLDKHLGTAKYWIGLVLDISKAVGRNIGAVVGVSIGLKH